MVQNETPKNSKSLVSFMKNEAEVLDQNLEGSFDHNYPQSHPKAASSQGDGESNNSQTNP